MNVNERVTNELQILKQESILLDPNIEINERSEKIKLMTDQTYENTKMEWNKIGGIIKTKTNIPIISIINITYSYAKIILNVYNIW